MPVAATIVVKAPILLPISKKENIKESLKEIHRSTSWKTAKRPNTPKCEACFKMPKLFVIEAEGFKFGVFGLLVAVFYQLKHPLYDYNYWLLLVWNQPINKSIQIIWANEVIILWVPVEKVEMKNVKKLHLPKNLAFG